MARHNIQERRAYIKSLLDNGEDIDIRSVARMWDSSYPAIVADIASCQGERDPYYKKVPQWIAQNQRAARLGVDGQITEQDWLDVLKEHNHMCANCGTRDDIVIDHIDPLSKGGANIRGNIQPLCRACNTSKSDKTPAEWATSRENGRKGGRPKKPEQY